MTRACVLLSGGLDSVAALHHALTRYAEVRAIGFSYGQPHRNAEMTIAYGVAARRHVPFTELALADALSTRAGLLRAVGDHVETGSLNPAFVPGRNIVFLSLAAAHALAWWTTGGVDLIIGACAEDASGFPDCREDALGKMTMTLREACARDVRVVAPFVNSTKASILMRFAASPFAIDDIQRSWSCYRGDVSGPCNTCTACVARARAFEATGLEDLSTHPMMHGGDPGRDARFA